MFSKEIEAKNHAEHILKNDEVLLISIEDNRLFNNIRRFDYLDKKTKLYEIDKNNIYLRNKHLLPSSDTIIYIIYRKNNGNFGQNHHIYLVNELPYTLYVDNENILTIESIDEKGNLIIRSHENEMHFLKDKIDINIFKEWRIIKRVIKNRGIYKKENFKIFETE